MPTFNDALANCAETITSKFTTAGKFQPEDQLKAPIETFFKEAGESFNLTIKSVTEAQVDDLGARPDLGIYVGGLLCGHVELKKPGLGANAPKFKGCNKAQWQKFKDLPNLIYTDGNEWALYRKGRSSSPLDDIRPTQWMFDNELLELLWVLDGSVDLLPEVNNLLAEILQGELFTAAELPTPTKNERKRMVDALPLFSHTKNS